MGLPPVPAGRRLNAAGALLIGIAVMLSGGLPASAAGPPQDDTLRGGPKDDLLRGEAGDDGCSADRATTRCSTTRAMIRLTGDPFT